MIGASAFQKDAEYWWDPEGPFAPLHAMNPLRIDFIQQQVKRLFYIAAEQAPPFHGLSFLDVGCGGGLLAEPLARLGATVCGIDQEPAAIAAATAHAKAMNLTITYRTEDITQIKEDFHVVTCLEVVEHVPNLQVFLEACALRVRPGGLLFLSTLNRTLWSYIGGIFLAEKVLKWVQKGAHDWHAFRKPHELLCALESHGFLPQAIRGMVFNPLTQRWQYSPSLCMNYIVSLQKKAS